MRTLLILIISCCIVGLATAQCPFTPTVTGDLLVCPEARTTLGTQAYDAYQWYTRPFGSSAAPQPVNGATGPAFTVDYDDTPLYVSVSATLNNCTELPLWRSYFDRQTEVAMSAWPEGMYILQLSAADGAMSRYKLIKNSKQ